MAACAGPCSKGFAAEQAPAGSSNAVLEGGSAPASPEAGAGRPPRPSSAGAEAARQLSPSARALQRMRARRTRAARCLASPAAACATPVPLIDRMPASPLRPVLARQPSSAASAASSSGSAPASPARGLSAPLEDTGPCESGAATPADTAASSGDEQIMFTPGGFSSSMQTPGGQAMFTPQSQLPPAKGSSRLQQGKFGQPLLAAAGYAPPELSPLTEADQCSPGRSEGTGAGAEGSGEYGADARQGLAPLLDAAASSKRRRVAGMEPESLIRNQMLREMMEMTREGSDSE
jgi:hypothetical protein